MALPQAILAVLVRDPASGYELAKKFDGSVGFFWKATHQQIYRELAKLEDRGWVESQAIARTGRPEKKIYSVTDLGITELQKWIGESTPLSPPKEDLLVKVFAGYLSSPATILAELETHHRLHQERLAIYQTLAQKYFSHPQELTAMDKFAYLTLRNGLIYETYWIDWCAEAIEMIEQA
jgi:DNA-binding PadR family transcriptional regulator